MAISFVNVAENAGDAGGGSIASPAANHTSGNFLIVFVNNANSRDVTSMSDTALNTYTFRGTNSNGADRQHVWTATSITGNANNIVTASFALNSPQFRRIFVLQYSASAGSIVSFHAFGVGSAASGTSLSTAASAATTQANAVIAAASYVQASEVFTQGANFTLRGNGEPTGAIDSHAEDRIVSSTGAYNAAMTMDVSAVWSLIHCIMVETLAGSRAPNQFMDLLGVGR